MTVTLLFFAVAAAQGDDAAWRDLESRIQYAYYTEDGAQLRALTEAVAAPGSPEKLRGYYAGLLAWRAALLAAETSGGAGADVGALAARCLRAIDETLALDPDFAEALALRAACLAVGGSRAPLGGYRARRGLDRALELAPHDPRVLLIDAMSDYPGASAAAVNRERALPKLRRAVAALETERGGPERVPGWGAAEAWLLLGRDLLEHGDSVAARDALEHALLIAPQFAQARRLMAKITSG
ncbi:MAG: hypothetical protein JO361_12020 [Gammaproteobacteria bacterium]|nr:hypothetical protein [Gammaproteobacteria bacterium]